MMNDDLIPQSYKQVGSYNKGYADEGVISLRLDTDPIKEKLVKNLLAITEKIELKDGKIIKTLEQGEAKVNTKGLQAIMQFLDVVFNSQTVQGYFKSEKEYGEWLYNFNMGLSKDLWINMYDYGISDEHFDGIIDSVMSCVEAFMTRPIEDRERRSYGESMQMQQIDRGGDKKKGGLLSGLLGGG